LVSPTASLLALGGPADIDIPTLGATDLMVRVHAASVNPVDIKTRGGKLKTLVKYRFPLVLGNDLAGVVMHSPTSSPGGPLERW
jgi:NADPH:quinone reductase-like Zn-dependent oxidoreductase